MSIFNFFRKNKKQNSSEIEFQKSMPVVESVAEDDKLKKTQLYGKDFEFLIRGEIELSNENYERVMTPNTISWKKILKNGWPYYQVGEDEFSYSWEMPGIQMVFNPEITYEKAKLIAEEVMANLEAEGQEAELVEIKSDTIYRFD